MKDGMSWNQALLRNIRRQFLAGALVLVPIGIAIFVLLWVFHVFDNILQPVIAIFFGHRITGLGILATLVLFFIVGVATNNYLGRKVVQVGEFIVKRVPILSDLYTSSKQVLEMLSGIKESNFKDVVIIEFPSPGLRTIAFITNEIIDNKGKKAYVILVPHSPNPITGFLQIVSEDRITRTDLSVRQALSMTISGGLASPPVINERPDTSQIV
jgi:uncharacterized membrane protein